ncbi:glycosyltransferase [Vibrio sp.]|nr:glycosyltransferase [Vibrio sp.]
MSKISIFNYRNFESKNSLMVCWAGLLLILFVCLYLLSNHKTQLPDDTIWMAVGIIGVWRYSWKSMHAIRAFYYRYITYPSLKKKIHPIKIKELFVVITSYRIDPKINYQVYRKLFLEVQDTADRVKIMACISDTNDMSIIEEANKGLNVDIHFIPQQGKGKRAAIADALKQLLQMGYHPDAQLALMDGDTLLDDDTFKKCCPFIHFYQDLGALTCHNEPVVDGNSITRQWYNQRMSMRHFYMNSLSLSNKLLVLTGRFSLFKAKTLLCPDFIHTIEHDTIDHWRLGKLKMLTGDDKTTWFYLIKHGWKMIYIPDVKIKCLEELPTPHFFSSSLSLMQRWYGNMLRSNLRALKLGPKKHLFLWLCLLDQRISVWTTLTGPTFVLILSIAYDPYLFLAYIVWVIITRGINCCLMALFSYSFHPMYIFLLWYEQIVGSFVKLIMMFHLDKQKWTRQKIHNQHSVVRWNQVILSGMMSLQGVTVLFIILALMHNVFNFNFL